MLIWPASSTFWGFLERDLNPVPEGTILRFALRRPLAPELSEKGQLVFNGYERNHPDLYKQAVEYVRNNPVKPKEKVKNSAKSILSFLSVRNEVLAISRREQDVGGAKIF